MSVGKVSWRTGKDSKPVFQCIISNTDCCFIFLIMVFNYPKNQWQTMIKKLKQLGLIPSGVFHTSKFKVVHPGCFATILKSIRCTDNC